MSTPNLTRLKKTKVAVATAAKKQEEKEAKLSAAKNSEDVRSGEAVVSEVT